MDGLIKPTTYNSGQRESIPNIAPEKRVGSEEYTKPTIDQKAVLEDSGIVNKPLTLNEKIDADEAKFAAHRRKWAIENNNGIDTFTGENYLAEPEPLTEPNTKKPLTPEAQARVDAAVKKMNEDTERDKRILAANGWDFAVEYGMEDVYHAAHPQPTDASENPVEEVADDEPYFGQSIVDGAKGYYEDGKAYYDEKKAAVEGNEYYQQGQQLYKDNEGLIKDVRGAISFDDGFQIKDQQALGKVGKRLGLTNDISRLSEGESTAILTTSNEFLNIAGGNGFSKEDLEQVCFLTEEGLQYAKSDAAQSQGIFGLVNSVAGNEGTGEFFNIAEETAFIYSLTSKAIEWGIPELIDQLTGAVHDTRLGQLAVERNLIQAARATDFVSFRKLWPKLHGNKQYALKERFLKVLLESYRKPEGVSDRNAGQDLIAITEMVYPKWHKDPYDPTEDYVYYFGFSSTQATKVLSRTQLKTLAYCGSRCRYKQSMTLLRTTMPNYSQLN